MSQHHSESPRILSVEDNPIAQKAALLQLGRHSYPVDTAASGKDALALLSQHHYALVLLDIGLGDMTGFEVLKQLRAQEAAHQTPRTPVVIVSANASEVAEQPESVRQWVDEVITKPMDSTRCNALVKRFLEA